MDNFDQKDLALKARMRSIMERQMNEFPETRNPFIGGKAKKKKGGDSTGGVGTGGVHTGGMKMVPSEQLGIWMHDYVDDKFGKQRGGKFMEEVIESMMKAHKKHKPKGGVVVGGGVTGGEMEGGKRKKKAKGSKTSPWIEHVKKYAKEHDISYGEAISKAGPSYKG